MLDSAASWAVASEGEGETAFAEYPDASIEDWHRSRGLYVE